ncbi:MAG TPA: hypothetical protein VK028_02980 [Micromonosporaceae bacterium]|nr:hypothetical protein [Micromonosporaceae bacterium]
MAVRRTAHRISARRRRLSFVIGVLAALLGILATSTSAYADPPTDDEGGSLNLREKLEQSAIKYYEARAKLEQAEKAQVEIAEKLKDAELRLARLEVEVANIAAGRYQGAQLNVLYGLFTGEGNAQQLLAGAALNDYLIWRDDQYLREYRETRDEAKHQQDLLNAAIAQQEAALKELDEQKREAEKALAEVGGMVSAGYDGPIPDKPQPAPRTASGGWPQESCSIDDPTKTGGCVTPRMYHFINEARLAGFNRYVACWRTQSWGEHPKGRACDFSVQKVGFGGAATGDERTYGNKLAQWSKENASALGVMYVIWYKQIWTPSTGWRVYSGCCDASSQHTNHVHISML